MNKQYMVQVVGKEERLDFYNFILNNFKIKRVESKKSMINSTFPFVVDFENNIFWVCNSITCCSLAQQNNKFLSKNEFKKILCL